MPRNELNNGSAKAQQEYKMNTKNLKAYAPKARSQFIEAIKKRAAQFGLYQDKIVEMQSEGSSFIIEGRAFSQKQGQQRQQLERKINGRSEVTHSERYNLFIREMAYTWFNRLAAIRYMELHDYLDHGFRVLSNPNNPESLPEIIDHASDVVDSLDPLSSSGQGYLDKNHIIELQLAGNKEEELYRELLLGQCHRLFNIMPFMFEAIDDATELLLPDNLTKTDSILKGLVNEIPEEDWSEIEVIGWLYQFYISEHKDAVIGKVVKSEDIPAATQLFTPNWIVKYLVQNSLGRQWLATYPESELKGKMEYYIKPAEQSDDVIEKLKAITPTSIDPEQIKVLDPAAGSGHILVEVYEVLREIYLERGYRLREIPELILTKNIYGLDIDDRAAQLAGFALLMKAREDDRRIFQRVEDGEVVLNVYSLQSTEGLDISKLWQKLNLEGKQKQGSTGGLFDDLGDESTAVIPAKAGIYKEYFELLQMLKTAFLKAKTLGSLIKIDNQYLQNLVAFKELLQTKEKGSDPSAKQAASYLLPILSQAISLSQLYDVVVANPPYMGSRGINKELKTWLSNNYPNTKSDLFSVFIERNSLMGREQSKIAIMCPNVWMYISSHEKLRDSILNVHTLENLMELPISGFKGASVQICAFVFSKKFIRDSQSCFIRLNDFKGSDVEFSDYLIKTIRGMEKGIIFFPKNNEFNDLPNKTLGYWVSEITKSCFKKFKKLSDISSSRKGMATCNDDKWLRLWHEVNTNFISQKILGNSTPFEHKDRWFPISKGGSPRKWYGNQEYLVNWENKGRELKASIVERYNGGSYTKEIRSESFYFRPYLTWSNISTLENFAVRFCDEGGLISTTGCGIYPNTSDSSEIEVLSAIINSRISDHFLKIVSPTLASNPGEVSLIPIPDLNKKLLDEIITFSGQCTKIAHHDWDSFERSWNFITLPIFSAAEKDACSIEKSFISLTKYNFTLVKEQQCLEENINKIIISSYGLCDELDTKVNVEDISLTMNSAYRYSELSSEKERELKQREDTMKELISYSFGCMMGRYSLDREGLVYAHSANQGFKDLVAKGTYKTFTADDDGIVPLASEDWLFEDDATTRFREFVKTVWDDEHLQENLEFVAESLCLHALKPVKGESANDTVRRYFSKQFYKDHCKTYKKRPIYWLFSSGKEKAFECLVYLHRYNEGTLARMRTEYVTPLMGKYDQQQSMLSEQVIEASNTEKRQIEKDLKSLEKKQAELRTFDEQLKHYAEMRITLDLDDGVKANYGKFGNLLADVKAIHGQLPEKIV